MPAFARGGVVPRTGPPASAHVDRVVLRPCSDPALWNAFALALPGGTGFHEWSFLDLTEELLGVHIERLVVEAETTLGIVPLVRRKGRAARGPRLPFPLLGPAVPVGAIGATLSAIRRWQVRHGLAIARFDLGADFQHGGAAAAGSAGMRSVPDWTLRVDLAHGSIETLRSGFTPRRRQSINRTVRTGVVSRPSRPGETSALLGSVLKEAYERHGADSPYPSDIGARFEDWAAGRNDVHHVSVFVDGQHAGSTTVLGWHPVALGWVGGALSAFHAARPTDLLYRDVLEWAIQHGNRAFDLTGRVNDDIERYKRSWGATLTPFLQVESSLVPTPLERALRRDS